MQTFHTPSFGDEDFDIPTMSHPHMQQQQQLQQQQHSHHGQHPIDQTQYQMHATTAHMGNFNEQQYNQWHADQQHQQHIAHHR